MILEAIVSTLDLAGKVNLAPIGVSWEGERLILRPYRDSVTFRNLTLLPQGVVNFTDNVLVFARCAVSEAEFATFPAGRVRGAVLADTCHWREFEVEVAETAPERTRFACRIVGEGRVRDFAGLNRAKHAVIEAAIAASRIPWLGAAEVARQVEALTPLVQKTAGPQEQEAFEFLLDFVRAAESGGSGSRTGAAGQTAGTAGRGTQPRGGRK